MTKASKDALLTCTLLLGSLSLAAACSAEGSATLRIAADGEEFVEDRIPAEVFVDGWELELDRFLVAFGEVEADGEALEGAFVVDLARDSGGAGHELGALTLPTEGRPMLGYRIAPLAPETESDDEDVMRLVESSASMWIEGRASKDGTVVRFAWPFETNVRYVECESKAELVGGETARSRLTIQLERLFFDDLDPAAADVAFDVVASADRNGDGEVKVHELWERFITGETRYQVGERDIVDLWGFLEAQAETLGHVDGDGRCERAP